MPQGESLFHKFPDYRVDLEPNSARVRVRFNGEWIADSCFPSAEFGPNRGLK